MNTSAIVAIIMGVLMMVLSFVLYPTLNNAMDDLYLYWVDSCKMNNERFVRAYAGTSANEVDHTYVTSGDAKGTFYGSGVAVVRRGESSDCTLASTTGLSTDVYTTITGPADSDEDVVESAQSDYIMYNERGNSIGHIVYRETDGDGADDADGWGDNVPLSSAGTVTILSGFSSTQPISNAEWVDVPSLLDQFGGIGRLVLSVMPIMVLASFLGLVAMGLIDYGRGMSQGGIAGAVGAAIIQLIVVIVLLEVLPTVIDAMVDANQSATGGRFSVNSQFQGIMGIIFAALPLLLIVGILGISGFMLFQKGRNFRAGGGFSFGG